MCAFPMIQTWCTFPIIISEWIVNFVKNVGTFNYHITYPKIYKIKKSEMKQLKKSGNLYFELMVFFFATYLIRNIYNECKLHGQFNQQPSHTTVKI